MAPGARGSPLMIDAPDAPPPLSDLRLLDRTRDAIRELVIAGAIQ